MRVDRSLLLDRLQTLAEYKVLALMVNVDFDQEGRFQAEVNAQWGLNIHELSPLMRVEKVVLSALTLQHLAF